MNLGPREALMFGLIVGMPVAGWYFAMRPQSAQISQDKAELAHMQTLLDKLRAETARQDDLEQANSQIADRIGAIEDRLPTTKGVDQIVRQVSMLAVQAGLAPPTLKSQAPVAAAHYREQPLSLSTTGTFGGFYQFLLSLERLPRITRVVDMSIESGKEPGSIEVDFTLSIYYLDEEAKS